MMRPRDALVLGALLSGVGGCQRVTHDCRACFSDEPAHCSELEGKYATKTSDEEIARCAAIERLCSTDRNGTASHREACGSTRLGYDECRRVIKLPAFSVRCERERRMVLPFVGVR